MATKPKPISLKSTKPAASKVATPKGVTNLRSAAAPAANAKSAAAKPAGISKPGVAKAPAARNPAPLVVASASPKPTAPAAPAAKFADLSPSTTPFTNANSLKKKDLIDRVLKVTGGKKKAVRDVVEATLNVLGDALSKGEMLNLPPFGKAKVSRPSDAGSGKAMTVKLRRGPGNGTGGAKAKLALADTGE